MLPMEKSVTFYGACANEMIPLINRSFFYKAKEGGLVRIEDDTTRPYRAFIVREFISPPPPLSYVVGNPSDSITRTNMAHDEFLVLNS